MNEEILSMENITKIYPNGVIANKDVTFKVRKGEIHALMGENGAGKSTLMKILFGIESYQGEIYFEQKKVVNLSSAEAIRLGIGMVHQHFMLVDSLNVYENVILGIEPQKGTSIDTKKAIRSVSEIAEKYNLNVDPRAKVEDISVGLKQKVEILKVLARGAKLLILDEPTAVLTPQETEELFEQLILLKESGHTIIFISHKIREVMQICDRITVLRGGKFEGVMEVKDVTEEDVSRAMVGRDVILKVDKGESCFGDVLLEVRDLNYVNKFGRKVLKDVSFKLRKRQILGVAGVEGNGQSELAETIFGFNQSAAGQVLLNGTDILGKPIKKIRDLGASYIPEDRMTLGVAKAATVWENLIPDRIDSNVVKSNGFLDKKKIDDLTNGLMKSFTIKSKNNMQTAEMLSGGNMQKIVVAREFSANPQLLMANQPTRGIDVGANEFIWKKIVELRNEGKAILLISADLNEVMELSDSIMIMCEGEVVAYFEDASQLDEKELGLYMLGLKRQEKHQEQEGGSGK